MANGAKINAQNKTINSGYCSGNQNVLIDITKGTSGVCKGTVRSYCAESGDTGPVEIRGDELNSGAFTGLSDRDSGSIDQGNKQVRPERRSADDSKVIGTLQSFNVGIPLGSEPSLVKSSFMTVSEKQKTHIDKENHMSIGNESYGTMGSFNAVGEGSKIDAEGATINSGCGAGSNDNVNKNLVEEIKENCYECGGTNKSFNAESGEQISINGAKLNTGAYAGIATEQGGTSGKT